MSGRANEHTEAHRGDEGLHHREFRVHQDLSLAHLHQVREIVVEGMDAERVKVRLFVVLVVQLLLLLLREHPVEIPIHSVGVADEMPPHDGHGGVELGGADEGIIFLVRLDGRIVRRLVEREGHFCASLEVEFL